MSSDLPKVAVLLAAYNGISWIEEQLVSILNQRDVKVTIFISVDPSIDGTEQWCAEFEAKCSNIVLLPAMGPFNGAAKNFFRLLRDVDLSGYDYIAFSDQDDIWYPEKLSSAVRLLRSKKLDGYSSNVVALWPNGRRALVDKAQPQVKWDYIFEAAGPGCTYVLTPKLAAAFKIFIISHWDKIQTVALHDWCCYAFARSRNFRWFIDPLPRMDYRQHANNQVGVNIGWLSAIQRLKMIKQGWWLHQVGLIMDLTKSDLYKIRGSANAFSGISLLKLAFSAHNCRRRHRDRIFFILVCIFEAFRKIDLRSRKG